MKSSQLRRDRVSYRRNQRRGSLRNGCRWTYQASLDVLIIPEGALVERTIDAVILPSPHSGFTRADARIDRLFPDYGTLARASYAKTGFFPIMHVVGIRWEIVAADSALPMRVFATFAEPKDRALDELARKARARAGACDQDRPQRGAALLAVARRAQIFATNSAACIARNAREAR